jgi:hypothetical protein
MVADHLVKVGTVKYNRYPVKSNYTSLKDAIAAGKCDYVNDYITANCSTLTGEIVVDTELVLYHPNRNIESDDVVEELDQMGLRPATLQELCAFGEKYPDIQREFPIVALGYVCANSLGYRLVPNLGSWYTGRKLSLNDWGGEWRPDHRFLAARKPACPAGR